MPITGGGAHTAYADQTGKFAMHMAYQQAFCQQREGENLKRGSKNVK